VKQIFLGVEWYSGIQVFLKASVGVYAAKFQSIAGAWVDALVNVCERMWDIHTVIYTSGARLQPLRKQLYREAVTK
jgi:hypothetical protein